MLLVDEATVALDAETANQVSNAILGLDDITCIVVTHSLDGALLRQYDTEKWQERSKVLKKSKSLRVGYKKDGEWGIKYK